MSLASESCSARLRQFTEWLHKSRSVSARRLYRPSWVCRVVGLLLSGEDAGRAGRPVRRHGRDVELGEVVEPVEGRSRRRRGRRRRVGTPAPTGARPGLDVTNMEKAKSILFKPNS